MEHIVDEFTVRRKTGIVPIIDMVSLHLISSPIGALAAAPRLVITTIGQKLLTDMPIAGDSHADIRMDLDFSGFGHCQLHGVICFAGLGLGGSRCEQNRN